MPRTGLTAEETRTRAVDLALAHMRRHGFDRVRLSDVARDLGVSHAALYAHFTDKAALLDAVTERWLEETRGVLDGVRQRSADPISKIEDWFVTLYRLKRERVLRDPEVYRAFDVAAALRKPFIVAHLTAIQEQLADLIKETEGALGSETPVSQAAFLYEALSSFLHPKLIAEHVEEDREPRLRRLLGIVLNGIATGS